MTKTQNLLNNVSVPSQDHKTIHTTIAHAIIHTASKMNQDLKPADLGSGNKRTWRKHTRGEDEDEDESENDITERVVVHRPS